MPFGWSFFDPEKPESLVSCLFLAVKRNDYGVNRMSQERHFSEHLIARKVFERAFKKLAEELTSVRFIKKEITQ